MRSECESCGEPLERRDMNGECGAQICPYCQHHQGLVRCFCGWAADGGDGRKQLEDRGENCD